MSLKRYSSKTVQYVVGSIVMLCVTNALELSPLHKDVEPNVLGTIIFLVVGLAVVFIGEFFQKPSCKINGESVNLEGIEMSFKKGELLITMDSRCTDNESLKSFTKLRDLFEQYQALTKSQPDTLKNV